MLNPIILFFEALKINFMYFAENIGYNDQQHLSAHNLEGNIKAEVLDKITNISPFNELF